MTAGGASQQLASGRFVRGGLPEKGREGRVDCRPGRVYYIPDGPEIAPLPLSARVLANAL